MGSERRVLEVNGKTVQRGTSLFDVQSEKVMWYIGVQDGVVTLTRLDDEIEMSESAFRTRILTRDILIESQPCASME